MSHKTENVQSASDLSLDYCDQLLEASDNQYNENTSEEYDLYECDCSGELSENDETTSSDADSSDENTDDSGEWSDEDLDDPVAAMHAQEYFAEIGVMPAIAG